MTNTTSTTESTVVTPVTSDMTLSSTSTSATTSSTSTSSSLATSVPPSVQLGKSDGPSTTSALKQRFVRTRPLYANSFGAQVFERSTKSGLKTIGWRVTGIVQQIWELLEPSLISLIQAKRQELELLRPSGAIGNPGYALRCFLMGPDQNHATPYVAILCETSWLCKGMGKLIIKSGLLAADGFECCGLPDKPELYRRKMSEGSDESDEDLELQGNHSLKADRSPVIPTLDGFQMHYTHPSGFLNGREVEVLYNGSPIARATVGGIVAAGGDRFEMTVRHAFSRPRPVSFSDFQSGSGSSGTDSLEIDFFDSADDEVEEGDVEYEDVSPPGRRFSEFRRSSSFMFGDSDDDAGVESTSHIKFRPMSTPGNPIGAGKDGDDDSDDDAGLLVEYPREATSTEVHASRLDSPKVSTEKPIMASPDQKFDWALRKIRMDLPPDIENDPSVDENVYFTAPVPTGSQRAVVLKTPFDLKSGILESSGVIGIPFHSTPQPVQVISMSSAQIQPGECGSWAMKEADGTFIGMLIGSCPTLGEAYILRMSDILDDIHNQTGLQAKVAPTFQPPNQEEFTKYKKIDKPDTKADSTLKNRVKRKVPFGAPGPSTIAESDSWKAESKRPRRPTYREEDEEGFRTKRSSKPQYPSIQTVDESD